VSKRTSWNCRYRGREHVDDAPLPLLVELVSKLPPGRALDLACGPGRHALHLAALGWSVTAVDSAVEGLKILRRRVAARELTMDIRPADLEKHEFAIAPSSFDLICDTFYLQRGLFPEIRVGVVPGGVFLGVIHVEDAAAPPMNPAFLLRPGELREMFADWDVLHYAEAVPQIGHRRLAAELICRRPGAPMPGQDTGRRGSSGP
jgi:SAM-dependent methyltransferase